MACPWAKSIFEMLYVSVASFIIDTRMPTVHFTWLV
jgi:hypothetical protein